MLEKLLVLAGVDMGMEDGKIDVFPWRDYRTILQRRLVIFLSQDQIFLWLYCGESCGVLFQTI